jgi:exodeoxyribonuclease VII large subunit
VDELRTRLPRHERALADLGARADGALRRRLRDAAQRLSAASSLLASLSYEGVLARGFALVRDEGGRPVPSAARARTETALEIQFHDGRVPTLVARPGSTRPTRQGPYPPGEQRRLL